MIRFNNDYNRGAFDCILKALADTNTTSYPGYGEDEWCDKAEQIIKGLIGRDDSMIKFIPGATQANYVVVAAALSSGAERDCSRYGTYQLPRGSFY